MSFLQCKTVHYGTETLISDWKSGICFLTKLKTLKHQKSFGKMLKNRSETDAHVGSAKLYRKPRFYNVD